MFTKFLRQSMVQTAVFLLRIITDNTSESFNRISFGNTAGGTDVFGFDDMTVESLQQIVPKPLTIIGSAIALGFGALCKKLQAQKA